MSVALEPLTSNDRQQIRDFMERGTRALGLRLCFHDLLRRSGLPKPWLQHQNPACLAVKRDHQTECAAFCGQRIEREVTGLPSGSIHTCPFGHTDIAAPVWLEGMLAGVLYAGVCWQGKDMPPRPGLLVHPTREWLEDRRLLLCALARELGRLLRGRQADRSPSRRETILTFVRNRLDRSFKIEDLASALHLSASRTGHLVKELFGETFPQLVTRLRLTHAARLLSATDAPAGEIALDTGFADQAHFTRAFRRHYRMTPLAFRRTYRVEV